MHNIPCAQYGFNSHSPAALFPAVANVPAVPALGEAPATMNVYVDLPGTGKVQVTGRGLTGLDAARMLKDGVEALKTTFAPPVPPTREAQLAQLLTKGLACAVSKGDTGLIERLAKAAALVLADAVEPTDSPAIMAVRSQSEPQSWYEVSGKVCSCPDSQKHLRAGEVGHLCKHILATHLQARLTESTVTA